MYKLLIVDDEKMIRMGIKTVLSRENIGLSEIFTASCASEALTIVEETQPDIMITDIQMSGITGLELIEMAREFVPQLRVIVVTGFDHFEYARQSLNLHVQNLFLKPIDEEDLIREVCAQIQYLQKQSEEMEQDLNQWRALGSVKQIRVEQCIRSIIDTSADYTEQIQALKKELRLFGERKLAMILIEPALSMGESQDEVYFRQMTIKNVCMGLIDAYGRGITFTDTDGRVSIVLLQQGEEENALEIVGELSEILKDEFDETLHFAIGSTVRGFENLHVSYNDAKYLLNDEKNAVHEVIQTIGAQKKADIFREIYTELKTVICYDVGNTDYVLKAFDAFTGATLSYNLSTQTVRRYCMELASGLYFSCMEIKGEGLQANLEVLSRSLQAANREEACEVTRMFIMQMLGSDEENENDTIARAKSYIKEHFAEDISVKKIAGHLYITSNYLSRLFRRVTGEGCNEYIIRQRIEKAKLLLETTSLKTGKIALMVGYRDINYFSLAFKKQTGKSPTKYRGEIMSRKDEAE